MRGSDAERSFFFFFFSTPAHREIFNLHIQGFPSLSLTKDFLNSFLINRLKKMSTDDPDAFNDPLITQGWLTCSLVEDPM